MLRTLATYLLAQSLPFAFGSAVGPSCDEVSPEALLPADGECQGWSGRGSPFVATTIEDLTIPIDGGAYLFANHGFVAAVFHDYRGVVGADSVTIEVSAYNQGSRQNAAALFADPGSGSGEPLPDWEGSGAARMRVSFGMVYLQYCEDCFFVSLLAIAGGDESVSPARCLGAEVLQRIAEFTPVEARSWGRLKSGFIESAP